MWCAGLAGFLLAADQLTKHLVTRAFWPGQLVVVIPRFLNVALTRNTGGAFSLFPGKPALFAALSVAAICLLGYLFVKLGDRPAASLAAAAVLAGAAGNLTDRFRYGYVVDFIDAHWGPWHWYVFNVADAAITVGAIGLIVATAWDDRRRKQGARQSRGAGTAVPPPPAAES
jgi:signal peptidase II